MEKPALGILVSPHGNQYIPIHNWYPYKHGYSRGLADYFIKSFDLSTGDWVLEPFCGGGTTLLTCKELGINACGFDILLFSVFLSNVKVGSYDDADLVSQLDILQNVDEILAEIGDQVGLTPKEIWAVRYRGNSSQQMMNYKRKPSRESVISWDKFV